MYGPGDVRFFDRLARLYDLAMPPARSDDLEAGLARADRPIERLLDLGGGTGRAATAIDAPERIVLDSAGGMVRRARERDLEAVRGDAGRLPFADGSLDAVVVVDALHHFPNQRAAVGEAYRALAPGGVLVVREFDPGTALGRGIVLAERALGFGSIFTGPHDLAGFLSEAGFDARLLSAGTAYTVGCVKPMA